MCRGDNRFHPDLTAQLGEVLDRLEGGEEPAALVITGSGKFFSNGLDLDFMGAHPDEADACLAKVHRMFARVLGSSVPTVAAINGHAFAAGAMLALACDAAVMREDRGYICLPEIDIGMVFTPGMNALLTARLSAPVAHEAMVTGRRYTAGDAVKLGMVAERAAESDVVSAAVERAAALAGKSRGTLAGIKRGLYGPALDVLEGLS